MKDKYPKAWTDFEEWIEQQWEGCGYYTDFYEMPFEMQLGVYLKYLEQNNLSILMEDVGDWDIFDHTIDIPLLVNYKPLLGVNDRLDYYKQAIEQAFEIIESKL